MRLTLLAVPTKARPRALRRCVQSYLENAARYEHKLDVLVCEDSADARGYQEAAAALHQLSSLKGNLQIVGYPEKVELARYLSKSGKVPLEIVEFGLLGLPHFNGGTWGANRNCLSLVAGSRWTLCVDDDTYCETYRPVNRDLFGQSHEESGAVLRSAASAYIAIGEDDDRGGLYTEHEVDCCVAHQRWLGCDADNFESRVKSDRGRQRRVEMTIAGALGDCGWGSPSEYLFLKDASLRWLTRSDESYAGRVVRREMLRAVYEERIGGKPDELISMCFAVAGWSTLPPFPPVCRGEDRVFGTLLRKCCPHAAVAHIPLVIRHGPETARRFWKGEVCSSAAGIDTCSLLAWLIDRLPLAAAAGPYGALTECGVSLESTGSLTPSRFASEMTEVVRAGLTERIRLLEETLGNEAVNAPCFKRDVSTYISALRKTAARRESYIPLDVRVGANGASPEATTQHLVLSFGRLLQHWHSLVEAAHGRDGWTG